ncbi:hypothetical protein N0V93_007136 [Gnomoniopsis smithogilvyi]|uniref:Uncharacterized protein n=1 Tax=Gnomoniopsis smithogilvyi TaxID=1191159 RepID=A0A9W8YR76_9PEZI|nr:hypothetical protein N0V93_007136 [Gnomoniopsis smithogilvyi]
MEVRVADAKTRAALEQDGSLRCLLKIKYKHRDRHSIPAIAWAKRKADEVSRGLLKGAGLEAETDGLTVSVNMVTLGEYHHSSFICYDVFLGKCTSESREKIDRSTRQPIYMILKRGGVFIAHRAPRMDDVIAGRYENVQEKDKGPRPYFRDSENPPTYIIPTGERVEAPWRNGAETNLEGESDDDGKENEDSEEDDGRADE